MPPDCDLGTEINKLCVIGLVCVLVGLCCCVHQPDKSTGLEWYRTASTLDRRSSEFHELGIDPRTGFQRLRVGVDPAEGFGSIELEPASVRRGLASISPVARGTVVGIDGRNHPISILIDTGTTSSNAQSMLDVAVLKILGSKARAIDAPLITAERPGVSRTPLGRGILVRSVLSEFQLGTLRFNNPLAQVDVAAIESGLDFDGVIGMRLFSLFDAVIFDWDGSRIWLTSDEWANFDFSGWSGVPMLKGLAANSNAVYIDVELLGHRFPALIDTGTTHSTVPSSMFDLVADGSTTNTTDLTTYHGVFPGEYAILANAVFVIGPLSFPIKTVDRSVWDNEQAQILDPAITDPCECSLFNALIGMDVLRQRSFALDFRNNTVWFAPEGWQGPPKVAE